ncbi:Protein trichome birefringence-like 19 [Vitis vinifera]|uniref:Protein trichome birefringence-like 19 n=1 Tax=Vitis vinifera TaxID=29760 RepID=A0A438EAV6_VITVI|nr:Protein trichome birefringence-like 19 [Vitis vinifera]
MQCMVAYMVGKHIGTDLKMNSLKSMIACDNINLKSRLLSSSFFNPIYITLANARLLASHTDRFFPMRVPAIEPPNGKNTPHSTPQKVIHLSLTLILLTLIPLCLMNRSPTPVQSPKIHTGGSTSLAIKKKCDMFSGRWVPYPNGPYYTNATCREIIPQQNCIKFGRPDTEFLKWRWKPDGCELPRFDPVQFLELVRGKSIGFVGDSVGRNQMQSLLCLLANVTYPVDISYKYTSDTNFRRWFYTDYKFTLATFWSPFLVKAKDADPKGHSFNNLMNLHLDTVDEAWAAQIENFDYVIISAGAMESLPDSFRTLQNLKNYKGLTFLRTFSPAHFENGAWNEGGNCVRTRPFTKQEMKLDDYNLEFYLTQVEELRAAEREGRKRGLEFRLLDVTEAMVLRPDGHPNHYGHSPHKNVTIADCVHWCTPGPIDTWNEFLLQMLKMEGERSFDGTLQQKAG